MDIPKGYKLVPVELLEFCYRVLNGGDNQLSGMEHGRAFRELRALLDAPAEWCSACQGRGSVSADHMNMKPCPDCKPAAQPHGEPVKPYGYMFHPDGEKDEEFFIYDAPKERVPDHRGRYWTATPLYAEQPAPVAVVPTMQAELAQANRQLAACAEQIEEEQQRLTAAEDLLRRARAVIEDRGWAELERDIAKFFKPQVKG